MCCEYIIPLYLVRFPNNNILNFVGDIKISPFDNQLRQKLQNLIPNDEFHRVFKNSLSKRVTNYFLSIPFWKNNLDKPNEVSNSILTAFEFLKVMRLVRDNPASLELVFEKDECGRIKRHNKYYPSRIWNYPSDGISAEFGANDIQDLSLIWKNFYQNVLHKKNKKNRKNRLQYAIFLHEMANQSYYFEPQILYNTMVLECLFSTSPQEIAYQISSRVAWFLCPLGSRGERSKRSLIFKTIKQIYDFRSKIVHGYLVNEQELREKRPSIVAKDNVRKILRSILMDENLINRFLSKKDDFNKYLISLTLQADMPDTRFRGHNT